MIRDFSGTFCHVVMFNYVLILASGSCCRFGFVSPIFPARNLGKLGTHSRHIMGAEQVAMSSDEKNPQLRDEPCTPCCL